MVPGDALLVGYSDGLVEPENVYGEEFGIRRLQEAAVRVQASAPSSVALSLMTAAIFSLFPAWLLCLVVAILFTVLSRELLKRYVEIVWPIVTYPSLTAFFAFALWLTWFR